MYIELTDPNLDLYMGLPGQDSIFWILCGFNYTLHPCTLSRAQSSHAPNIIGGHGNQDKRTERSHYDHWRPVGGNFGQLPPWNWKMMASCFLVQNPLKFSLAVDK